MAFIICGKVYRTLQGQVLKNTEDIEKLKEQLPPEVDITKKYDHNLTLNFAYGEDSYVSINLHFISQKATEYVSENFFLDLLTYEGMDFKNPANGVIRYNDVNYIATFFAIIDEGTGIQIVSDYDSATDDITLQNIRDVSVLDKVEPIVTNVTIITLEE